MKKKIFVYIYIYIYKLSYYQVIKLVYESTIYLPTGLDDYQKATENNILCNTNYSQRPTQSMQQRYNNFNESQLMCSRICIYIYITIEVNPRC